MRAHDPSCRLPWIEQEALLNTWQGSLGGESPADAYRRYVEAGLSQRIRSPFEQEIDRWILGSADFAERVRELLQPTVDLT